MPDANRTSRRLIDSIRTVKGDAVGVESARPPAAPAPTTGQSGSTIKTGTAARAETGTRVGAKVANRSGPTSPQTPDPYRRGRRIWPD